MSAKKLVGVNFSTISCLPSSIIDNYGNKNPDKKSIHHYRGLFSQHINDNNCFCVGGNAQEYNLIEFDHIFINQNDDFERIKSYKIIIGGYDIIEIDFHFLKQLFPDAVCKQGDKMIYTLHLNNFLQHMIHYTTFHLITIMLTLYDNYKNNDTGKFDTLDATLYGNVICSNDEKLKCISQTNKFDKKILQLQSAKKIKLLGEETDNISLNLNFFQPTHGFFIETNNTDDIKNIIITVNENIEIINVDKFQIDNYCKKIGKFIYLSLNQDLDIWSYNLNSTLNLSACEKITVSISSSSNINTCRVYCLTHNILKYQYGMAGMAYA